MNVPVCDFSLSERLLSCLSEHIVLLSGQDQVLLIGFGERHGSTAFGDEA